MGELGSLALRRELDGNLAVLEGVVARAMGVPTLDAVLVELRGSVAALLSAAVRLDAITATTAQVVLSQLAGALHHVRDDLAEDAATAEELVDEFIERVVRSRVMWINKRSSVMSRKKRILMLFAQHQDAVRGNLIPDAALAVLAIEHGVTLASTGRWVLIVAIRDRTA